MSFVSGYHLPRVMYLNTLSCISEYLTYQELCIWIPRAMYLDNLLIKSYVSGYLELCIWIPHLSRAMYLDTLSYASGYQELYIWKPLIKSYVSGYLELCILIPRAMYLDTLLVYSCIYIFTKSIWTVGPIKLYRLDRMLQKVLPIGVFTFRLLINTILFIKFQVSSFNRFFRYFADKIASIF